jgi:LDH2 family malate/lactate/ureidoglycolate dehydrogenase
MTEQHVTTKEPAAQSFSAVDLRHFTARVFDRLGMRTEDADVLAEHLVWADLHGIPSLGVRKIPQYGARIRRGGTRPDGVMSVVHEHGAVTHVDGDDTWGQVVGARGMQLAVDKAGDFGVGVAIVRNTTSAGSLGRLATFAVDAGLIGIAINNCPPLQPVWGSSEKTVGNQAFAIASPAGDHPPLVLDMATSAITMARLHEFQAEGKPLPQGVAIDADGTPTVDPAAALKGLLLPMGGHRGSGLALMWEVLTGVLAGGERFLSDTLMPDVYDRPQGISLFLMAIDPTVLMPRDEFEQRVDRLIDHVHAARPASGFDSVRVPGEGSHAIAERRQRDGIPVAPDLASQLRKIGAELGIAWPPDGKASDD